jgi:hypothetical protein
MIEGFWVQFLQKSKLKKLTHSLTVLRENPVVPTGSDWLGHQPFFYFKFMFAVGPADQFSYLFMYVQGSLEPVILNL